MCACNYAVSRIDKYTDYTHWIKVYSDDFNDDDRGCYKKNQARGVILIIALTEGLRLIGNIAKCVLQVIAKIALYLPAKSCERPLIDEEDLPKRKDSDTPVHPFQQCCITALYEKIKPLDTAAHSWKLVKGIFSCIIFCLPDPDRAYRHQNSMFQHRESSTRNLRARSEESA